MKVTLKCTVIAGAPAHTDKDGKAVKDSQKTFEPGSVVDLPKPEAERLIAMGHATAGEKAEPEKADAPKKPKGQALTAAVADAIANLSPLDEFVNKAGKPIVAAVEKVLGYDISEADRDAGWEAFQAQHPDLFKAAGDDGK